MIADSTKTVSEKHIEKIIKQKSISRDEAKRMFKCKFCQIDGHFEVDCCKKKSANKDNSSDKDKTAKDKETKTLKSVFFSKSSAQAAADPDSEDESYESRAYLLHAIQSNFLTSFEGGPKIVSEDDSLPGLIDDSDSDDDSDVTTRHVRRRLPWQSRVDPTNRFFQGVYVAGRTSAARTVDDNISGLSVFGSLQQLGA